MALCIGSRHRLGFVLLRIVVCFAFLSLTVLFGQAPSERPAQQIPENEEIHRLNEKIAAQAQKIADQAEQLATQQTQINALQLGLAEQKALVNKVLQSGRAVLVNQPSLPLDGAAVDGEAVASLNALAGAALPSALPKPWRRPFSLPLAAKSIPDSYRSSLDDIPSDIVNPSHHLRGFWCPPTCGTRQRQARCRTS